MARLMALDALRLVPHAHIMSAMSRYHYQHNEAAPLLNKITVDVTVSRMNVYDVLHTILTTSMHNGEQLSDREITLLLNFAVSLYKAWPTEAALVKDDAPEGELWHLRDARGTELFWVMCVSERRAARLESVVTLKPGYYAVAVSEAMKQDALKNQLAFLTLFQGYYGIDRRPIFLGDLESVPSVRDAIGASATIGSSTDALDRDAHFVSTLFSNGSDLERKRRPRELQRKDPKNAAYFQLRLPSNALYVAEKGQSGVLQGFITKALKLYRREREVERAMMEDPETGDYGRIGLTDIVSGWFGIHVVDLQAYHNVALPYAITPKTWKLFSVVHTSANAADGEASSAAHQLTSSKKKKKLTYLGNGSIYQGGAVTGS